MIRKLAKKRKWRVYSESGRNMGTYPSKPKAQTRLRQVEAFKHMRKRK